VNPLVPRARSRSRALPRRDHTGEPLPVRARTEPPVASRARVSRGAIACLGALALGIVVLPRPASAQEVVVVDDARLHPSLAGVVVTGQDRSSYASAYGEAVGRHGESSARLRQVIDDQAAAATREAELRDELTRTEAERDRAEADAERRRSTLRSIGVASYMSGGSAPSATFDQEAADAESRQRSIVATVTEGQQDLLRTALGTIDRTTTSIDADLAELGSLTERIAELSTTHATAEADLRAARAEVARSRASLADWRLGADVAGSDLPLVALDAYVKAAERLAAEQPQCGIRWWGLAGIGRNETRHGTFGGTRPGPDGVPLRTIIGIPLDGNNGTALIPDSDGGQMDGDVEFDRAVGPMQFIPGTWRSQGRDGDGDGRVDVHDLHDAALAAAAYLCRAGGSGLDQAEGLRRAALGYNNSGHYADLVVQRAFEYAEAESRLIPPPPLVMPVDPLTTDPLAPPPEVPAPDAAGAPASPTSPPTTASAGPSPAATPSTAPVEATGEP
jgi:membrane-bound lytic murein transglycosylase B